MSSRFKIVITLIVVLTLANGGLLGYTYTRYSKTKNVQAISPVTIQKVVEQKIEITNPKKKTTTNTELGKRLGEGDYKVEELAQSKIKNGAAAELVIATHEASGGHFVLALLKDAKLPPEKINSGWMVNSIANDPMWAPGACSFKPTFLLQGKYIFIDDGKVNPADKYSSYIVFNMLTGKYNYFGGDNFTSQQGDQESIIKVVNENDKLVLYIDPADKTGGTSDNGSFVHNRGRDLGYIIRREVDPATMHYTDYSLPYVVPTTYSTYSITSGYGKDELINIFDNYQNPTYFGGRLANNAIVLTEHSRNDPFVAPSLLGDNLEEKLDKPLRNALPQLAAKQALEGQDDPAATKFSIIKLGSHESLQFLVARQKSGLDPSRSYANYGYETPAIYNSSDGSIAALTDNLLLNFSIYVPLGVF